MGIRRVSGGDPLQISHDLIEWQGSLEGLDGLLLLLFLTFLYYVYLYTQIPLPINTLKGSAIYCIFPICIT